LSAHWESRSKRPPVNKEEKDRKAALVNEALGLIKLKGPRKYRRGIRTKKIKAEVERRMLNPNAPAILPSQPPDRPEPPELSEVAEIQREIEERRLRWMARSVKAGVLDPSSLRDRESPVLLPPEAMDLIEKSDFSPEDLKAALLAIGRDNLAELVALLKDKDPRVKLEAFRLLRDVIYGDKKTVMHAGQDGGPMQLVVKLVAPDGRESTLERPKLPPA